jgi:hypothetical protein
LSEPWSEADVRAHIAVAARTLRWLKWDRPRIAVTPWPEIARDFWEAHNNALAVGETITVRQITLPPEPGDFDMMDQAIPWLYWIKDPRIRNTCLLYGELGTYALVADVIGMSETWCRHAEQQAVMIIVHMLNRAAQGPIGRTL